MDELIQDRVTSAVRELLRRGEALDEAAMDGLIDAAYASAGMENGDSAPLPAPHRPRAARPTRVPANPVPMRRVWESAHVYRVLDRPQQWLPAKRAAQKGGYNGDPTPITKVWDTQWFLGALAALRGQLKVALTAWEAAKVEHGAGSPEAGACEFTVRYLVYRVKAGLVDPPR